jgi:uncharacterized protein YeeX (DUF496 family)
MTQYVKEQLDRQIERTEGKIRIIQYAIDNGKKIEVPVNEKSDNITIEMSHDSLPWILECVKDELKRLKRLREEIYETE